MRHLELELARTKLTVSHLARHAELSEAESMLRHLRETVTFLERRIAREKVNVVKEGRVSVDCDSLTN